MGKTGYVVTHTHWDREWRYPIWESRSYLAKMVDELLDVLEDNPEYKAFLFDGQSVFIEDYLAVRPENTERLKQAVGSGRILAGPWYTLPDLFPISGESIVRNLLKGDRVCRKWGHKLSVGYESFGWGKPSQFPQIYDGFDIHTVIVAKHVSEKRAPEAEFLWEGKDGTRVLATRLGNEARAGFYMYTYMEAMSGKKYKSPDFRFEYGRERIYHQAQGEGSEQDYFSLTHREYIHEGNLKEAALLSWDAIENTTLKNDRVLMDGSDSTSAQPQILELIDKLNETLAAEGITLVHSSVEEYARVLEEKADPKNLMVIRGELRDGPAPAASANALMTRYPLKKLNRLAEAALMQEAEPLAVAGHLAGLAYNRLYLQKALDYLLLSHSHDSINGVTQDKTVRDVSYRLDQCLELSGCVKEQVMRYIAGNIAGNVCAPEDILILLVNPLPFSREEIIRLVVDTPADECIWDFSVSELTGKLCRSEHISRQETVVPVVNRMTRAEPFYCDRHEILLETGTVPAGGYKILKLTDYMRFERKQKFWPQTRKTAGEKIARSAVLLENEFLKVRISGDGSVMMLDKVSGYETDPLNYLESEGDVGDYWVHYPAAYGGSYTSLGKSAVISLEENTSLQASVRVRCGLEVPAYGQRPSGGISGESSRSAELACVPVDIRYQLKRGARELEVCLKIRNTARDHRMCVKFHTGIHAASVSARGHFCVDDRAALSRADEKGQRYPEMDTYPMQGFVDISDGKNGFGVLSRELGEYDASVPGILSCTLFRAVRNIICTEFRSESSYPSQQGGQLLEDMEFNYHLMLHEGGWEGAELENRVQRIQVPVRCAQFSVDRAEPAGDEMHAVSGGLPGDEMHAVSGGLPGVKSFYQVSGATVSSLKLAEDGENIILRIYNPYPYRRLAEISFAAPVKAAWMTDLNETRAEECRVEDGIIRYEIMPDKIQTFEIILESGEKYEDCTETAL